VEDDRVVIFSRATGLPVIIDFTITLTELQRLGVIKMGGSVAVASDDQLVAHEQTLQA
jgi:hypothetical protein